MEAELALLNTSGDFADGAIALEGQLHGANSGVSFDWPVARPIKAGSEQASPLREAIRMLESPAAKRVIRTTISRHCSLKRQSLKNQQQIRRFLIATINVFPYAYPEPSFLDGTLLRQW